jgi:hypothetical protein
LRMPPNARNRIASRHFVAKKYSRRWLCHAARSAPPRPHARALGRIRNTSCMNANPDMWSAERTALACEALQRSGFLRLQLRGLSMLPALWPGDEVEIANCSADDLKRGDVVLAIREQRFVLHRVCRFSKSGELITQGDAMPRADPALPAPSVVGKMMKVTRGGRTISLSRRCTPFRRALGLLFCYSSRARQIALKLHDQRIASASNKTMPPCEPEIPASVETQLAASAIAYMTTR